MKPNGPQHLSGNTELVKIKIPHFGTNLPLKSNKKVNKTKIPVQSAV